MDNERWVDDREVVFSFCACKSDEVERDHWQLPKARVRVLVRGNRAEYVAGAYASIENVSERHLWRLWFGQSSTWELDFERLQKVLRRTWVVIVVPNHEFLHGGLQLEWTLFALGLPPALGNHKGLTYGHWLGTVLPTVSQDRR